MIDELGSRRERAWDLLERVADGSLPLAELFDSWECRDLDGLRRSQSDVDLNTHIAGWQATLCAELGSASETARHYLSHVRTLVPAGVTFMRSDFTYARILAWFNSRNCTTGTRRKYRASLMSFVKYLLAVGVLHENPVQKLPVPKAGRPRQRHLEHDDVLRLVNAQPEPFRTLSALMHGSGMEISAALRTKRSDVDTGRRRIQAHGTKSMKRDRSVVVEPWAWQFLEDHLATIRPHGLLFPEVTRWSAGDQHRKACEALEIPDYKMHDARHTFAVRALRAGASAALVAQQLGHSTTQMVVQVYGRHMPSDADVQWWERNAAAQDTSRNATYPHLTQATG